MRGDFQQYAVINFSQPVMTVLEKVRSIIASYAAKGMRMTVRQIYYRLVTSNTIPNSKRAYKSLVKWLTDGRLAGVIQWDGIEDRHRSIERRQHWESGKDFMNAAARSYHKDLWIGQDYRPFLFVEKDALSGVFSSVCYQYDVPLLPCKGYVSASMMRDFSTTDLRYAIAEGQRPVVLHFGDHDPSGVDMTRDMFERMTMFLEIEEPEIKRMALNMPQVEQWKLPPNPANQRDARFAGYRRRFGVKCWELDAIEPEELRAIATRAIRRMIDFTIWDRRQREIAAMVKRLEKHARKFKG